MNSATFWIAALGLLGQALFSARLLVQWISSEKAKKVLSPLLFWQISLIASMIFLLYGALRLDPVIILGQLIGFFIYIRNIYLKKAWSKLPVLIRIVIVCWPIFAVAWLAFGSTYSLGYILANNSISASLLTFGFIGQLIFTFRFVVQWLISEKRKTSVLPFEFWLVSLVGGAMMLSYAIYRMDIALFIGNIFGVVVYARNLFILKNEKKQSA